MFYVTISIRGISRVILERIVKENKTRLPIQFQIAPTAENHTYKEEYRSISYRKQLIIFLLLVFGRIYPA
jgi:hypothetical protein